MKDKNLREILFGEGFEAAPVKHRQQVFSFPAVEVEEKDRVYKYRKDDGFILTLIKMIEKLEDRISILEKKKK